MNIAIILSGGIGSRLGLDIPKQYAVVNGQPIINYCLRTFMSNNNTDAIVIGVADEWLDFVKEQVNIIGKTKPVYYSSSGETRQYSVYNALKAVKNTGCADDDIVIIHDAARPLLTTDLIGRCYKACLDADCVMPAIPVKDTTYLSEDGVHIKALLDRSQLRCGQSPEAFRFGKYLQVHEKMGREEILKINGSTELAFKGGLECMIIDGDPMNFKITTPEDLLNFKSIIEK